MAGEFYDGDKINTNRRLDQLEAEVATLLKKQRNNSGNIIAIFILVVVFPVMGYWMLPMILRWVGR